VGLPKAGSKSQKPVNFITQLSNLKVRKGACPRATDTSWPGGLVLKSQRGQAPFPALRIPDLNDEVQISIQKLFLLIQKSFPRSGISIALSPLGERWVRT